MIQRSIPAVFMRGGTSKAIMFHARDLPADRTAWDRVFTAAMGSPDPSGRQLDGMGGGVSSLSKVCVLAPSQRDDADVDYTFAQILIKEDRVDYSGNCGNMSSAVGPFAVDEGLVSANGNTVTARIYNTNTRKLIHATFAVEDGRSRYDGDLVIPGVSGTGAPIRLDFIDPGGATTERLLPSGQVVDRLDIPGFGAIEASLVDAANATVFVRARDIGLTGTELPEQLEQRPDILHLLNDIRVHGSVRMGIAPDIETARTISVVPFVCFVSPPADARTLSGESISGSAIDLAARVVSNGQPHRALPLTVSLLHRGRGTYFRHRGCASVFARRAGRSAASRHAIRRSDRGERGRPRAGPVGGARRLVLSHRAPAVRRTGLGARPRHVTPRRGDEAHALIGIGVLAYLSHVFYNSALKR